LHIGWIGFIQYEQMYKFKGGVVMLTLKEIEDRRVELTMRMIDIRNQMENLSPNEIDVIEKLKEEYSNLSSEKFELRNKMDELLDEEIMKF